MKQISGHEYQALVREISQLEERYWEQNPQRYLRPPLAGEVELFEPEKVLGVVSLTLTGADFSHFVFESWAELTNICTAFDVPIWEPDEVAESIGCTLSDLGFIRGAE